MKTISVITPCFNEEENVQHCYEAVRDIFQTQLAQYRREHIFCDNASTDRTQQLLKKIASGDDQVRVIVNARNFGPLRNTFQWSNGQLWRGRVAFFTC
ncbi:glycosyltransferase involved in cell wall biosynthesis [Bradyrhizobium sp. GM5.1]